MTRYKTLPRFLYMSETRAGKATPESVIPSLPVGAAVAIREYDVDGDARRRRVAALVRTCEKNGVPYLVAVQRENDKALAPVDSGLFLGFHFPRHARAFLCGAKETFGRMAATCSVHDEKDAREAARLPVAAVIVSPFFSVSHKEAGAPLGAEGFSRLRGLSEKPAFALGGISRENWTEAMRAGAFGVAGVSFFH